jgi:hypothetical protein
MDSKLKAILAHITIVGWLIAWALNSPKDPHVSFFLRQTLPLHIIWMAFIGIPLIGWIIALFVILFWMLSFVYAVQNQRKIIPFGEKFQEWFNVF